MADETVLTPEEFSQLLESHSRKLHPSSLETCRQMQKVPPQIRLRAGHLYDPQLVSLGPYHHGKPELRHVEEFKRLCLDWFSGGNEEKKLISYNAILEKMDGIRGCYAEREVVDRYDDRALALMMLLDGSFVINFMVNSVGMEGGNTPLWVRYLGMAASSTFAAHDIVLLENQVPFQVLKLLVNILYDEEEGKVEMLLQLYIAVVLTRDLTRAQIPRSIEDPPIHILEACWRVSVEKPNTTMVNINAEVQNPLFPWRPECLTGEKIDDVSYTACRSVTDLRAKGIVFTKSPSRSITDISFRSHAFYGQLQLPARHVSDLTHVFFSNMIAYEVSPNSNQVRPIVLSYAVFMKSLIQTPDDVKELQENGILLNAFANDEDVVRVFREIDTFGYRHLDIYHDVKWMVEEHCRSRAKTWIADLVHTWFQSPWTVVGLCAATCLLCLTFLQTFVAIRPLK